MQQIGFARETERDNYRRLMQPVNLKDNVMEVQQVIFDFEAGTVRNTDWGKVRFNPMALARSTGMGSGYYNMFVHSQEPSGPIRWVVQNLYIPEQLSNESIPMSVFIDLRPGIVGSGPVESITVNVVASESVLPVIEEIQHIADTFKSSEITVSSGIINAEGVIDGFDGIPEPGGDNPDLVGPPPLSPYPVPGPLDKWEEEPIFVFQDHTRNLESGVNQCLPVAFANTFQYLEDRYNVSPLVWDIPHFFGIGFGWNIPPSWFPVPDYRLVAAIDALTKREGVLNMDTGDGAIPCQWARGAMGYMAAFGDQAAVEFRHQGVPQPGFVIVGDGNYCDTHPDIPFNGLISYPEGQEVTWDWIFDQLTQGRGVVLTFTRFDKTGAKGGSHGLRIWGAMRANGRDYIYTIDDSQQGNNNIGIQTQFWEVADTGSPGNPGIPDGSLNISGNGASGQWEITAAMSVEAKPTLILP
ncbi:MAG: hypothetical protein OEV42_19120 [Deltaproteobacteria bacterium]|nr:hypothetical protein [Deltaproteobacteria bacterium]